MLSRRWRSRAAAALCAHAGIDDPVEAVHHLTDALLDVADVTEPPVNLELLSSMRGVRIIASSEMLEAGRLIPADGHYVIQLNQRHPATKRRFTIAHELTHTFFDDAARMRRDVSDRATGLFDIAAEEEYLCDLGAARILLNPRWLDPLLRSQQPSIDALITLAATCEASIEATAVQVAQSEIWRCTFAFWEPGFRKAESIPAGQAALAGWDGPAGPAAKLRVRRVYAPPGVPFLPLNKSVAADSQIQRAYLDQTRTEGEEHLDLGRIVARAYAQSVYAPYYGESGVLRPRVITCLVWLVS